MSEEGLLEEKNLEKLLKKLSTLGPKKWTQWSGHVGYEGRVNMYLTKMSDDFTIALLEKGERNGSYYVRVYKGDLLTDKDIDEADLEENFAIDQVESPAIYRVDINDPDRVFVIDQASKYKIKIISLYKKVKGEYKKYLDQEEEQERKNTLRKFRNAIR